MVELKQDMSYKKSLYYQNLYDLKNRETELELELILVRAKIIAIGREIDELQNEESKND